MLHALSRARTTAIAACLFVTLGMPGWAHGSGDTTKNPRLTSAPSSVGFKGDAVIRGKLEGSTASEQVSLQARTAAHGWRTVATKRINERDRVRFTRTDLRVTTRYRLLYKDPATAGKTTSDVAWVQVRPRIRVSPSKRHVMKGTRVTLYGRLLPKRPDRKVVIEQKIDGQWRWLAKTSVNDGRFKTRVRAKVAGFRRLRATFRGDAFNPKRRARNAMFVYRPSRATWYGPGFYGNTTACGRTLRRGTLGVAHRTLSCGTKVSVLYRGRTITVPVIDRGPYANHADWDLTEETAERLGFSGVDTIGVTVRE